MRTWHEFLLPIGLRNWHLDVCGMDSLAKELERARLNLPQQTNCIPYPQPCLYMGEIAVVAHIVLAM